MINSKRVSKLKSQVYKIKGNPTYTKFIVEAREGLFLFEANKGVIHHREHYTKLDKPIPGLEVVDCSSCSIDGLLIVGDGKSEPVIISDDIPYADEIAEGYLNNNENPYKNLSREQLIEIAGFEYE